MYHKTKAVCVWCPYSTGNFYQ